MNPNDNVVRFVNDSRAIQSERASDFDTYSAYGEVVDNSIQANAKVIQIKFETSRDSRRGRSFENIDFVAFGDDGTGMDSDTLHKCLQLGFSSRYNDRKGIGRFGVGMTKGAIHECQRVEIYSKQETTLDWLYTYIDIEEISSGSAKGIPTPIKKEIPPKYSDLLCADHGTLVIWSKYDRQDQSASKIIEETNYWMGRTYRKFIIEGVSIQINGMEVKAFDPLFLNTEFTNFPGDPKATPYGETNFDWEVDDPDLNGLGIEKSTITIRFALLPEEFRKYGRRESGRHAENNKRYIFRNESISILRNNREVRDPENLLPHWKNQFKESDRFWGCEILFQPELDNWFQVKNIKRGATPRIELRKELEKHINPVRDTMLTEIKSYWDQLEKKAEDEKNKSKSDLGIPPQHTKSEDIAKETPSPTKDQLGKGKDPEIEVPLFVENKFPDADPERRDLLIQHFKKEKITILEELSSSPLFFEVNHFGEGKKNISYNKNHPFFQKYFQILENIRNGINLDKQQEEVLTLVDLIVIAFSETMSQYDKSAEMQIEDLFEDLLSKWGFSLKGLFKKWNELYNGEHNS